MRTLVRTVGAACFLLAATTCVAVPTGSAASGVIVDEGWIPGYPTDYGRQGVRFRDVLEYNEIVSVLRARPDLSTGAYKTCTSITSAPCSTVPRVDFSASLQPCSADSQLDCVVEFGTVDSTGKRIPAVYSGVFPAAGLNDFPAEPSVGLPAGGPGGLWTVAESTDVPVRTHLVRAVVGGYVLPGQKAVFSSFAANLSPVAISRFPCSTDGRQPNRLTGCRTGDWNDPTGEVTHGVPSEYAGYTSGYGENEGFDCLLAGNFDPVSGMSDCAGRKAIKKDVTYYLSVRLSQAVSGWMHGRLAEPAITLSDVPGATGAVALSVSGKAVSVPSIVLDKKFIDLPANLQDAYRATGGWPSSTGGYHAAAGVGAGGTLSDDDPKRNKRSSPSPFGADSIAELEAWLPVVNDTAIADPTSWMIRTLGSGELGAAEKCVTSKNKVMGIVTTNATLYKAGAPVFDSATKSLNYTVAAPHYMSSGDVFKGAYGMIIRSDVARCIYGFSSAPIKASIEVIDTGAAQNTVLTSVSETDGWMKLTATGFTHSTPTIKTVFTQESTVAAPPTATEPATPTPATPATAAPAAVPTPATTSFAVGRTVSRSVILSRAKLVATSRSRVTLSVLSAAHKTCKVVGSSVRMTKKGTCSVQVTVTSGSKRITKTVKLTVA